jgi:hypothetical protein
MFPNGHETFFIVAGSTMQQVPTEGLLKEAFPELVDKIDLKGKGNVGLISTEKAKRMLGWEEGIDNRMK